MKVAGVDACPGGWVVIVTDAGRLTEAVFLEVLADLPGVVPDLRGVGIDIPIGLPSEEPRDADLEARAFVGLRRNSVFVTPVREVLLCRTHAEATRTSVDLTGRGVTQQAWRLGPKILEAEEWVDDVEFPVWEVHPEVSFAVLLGHPATSSKKKWAGMRERIQALGNAGIDLGDVGDAGKHAQVDDILDAAVAAWSAGRLVRNAGRSFPSPPPRDPATQREVAIWA